MTAPRRLLRDALDALGIRRFLLGIHDAAFPMGPDEDLGRGTPHSAAAADLLALAASLGFDGFQLGPQGATSRSNPSPYDGALFSRDPLALALLPLVRAEAGHLLRPETLAALAGAARAGGTDRVRHASAWDLTARAVAEVTSTFRRQRDEGVAAALDLDVRLAHFRAANARWLERDALHELLQRAHGGRAWEEWPDARDRALLAPAPGAEAEAARRRDALLARHAREVEDHALVQLLLHEEHAAFRARARGLGLSLFGDLQIGLSERDVWASQSFLLPGWRMGAPPSRTDPEGQPWGFAVLHPHRLRAPDGGEGPALRFFRERIAKVLAEYDGIRVDHPHGFVTPWVYRPEGDLLAAVRDGARLLDSPAVREHPELAAYAIARPDQIDPSLPRHADGWVRSLDEDQVDRYALLVDAVVERAPDARDVACEVLSTLPYPLARVLGRHGLGRFRVTQKASLDDPADVYRAENAAPEDWIMLGSHDTPPIWTVAERWIADGSAPRRARRLAERLVPRAEREGWAGRLAADAKALAQASFAELFLGPARNVVVYFTDLLGERAPYNVPGTVSDENWSLRVPADVARLHGERQTLGAALDVTAALALALRARGIAPPLAGELERAAAR